MAADPSVSPADTIRRMLDGGDFCSYCARPLATEQDWAEYPEGGGEHLCWDGGDAGCTADGAITLRRDDVTELLAVGERDKAEIAELEAEVVRLRDRAVCSGCGSDVGESGVCPYPGCDDGEMIPASDLPSALRALCDRLTEEWKEWRAETAEDAAERERYRRQIAQLTEALREQWAWNHSEHCCFDGPHEGNCFWPLPVILGGDPAVYRTYSDPAAVLAGEEDAANG